MPNEEHLSDHRCEGINMAGSENICDCDLKLASMSRNEYDDQTKNIHVIIHLKE